MLQLLDALKSYDLDQLNIIANRWDVDIHQKDTAIAAEQLAEIMLNPERASSEWERLHDDERGALQMLIAVPNNKMPRAQFERLYGAIRQMGPEKRKREKPHLKPNGKAEVLYYRGLVFLTFDEGKTGVQPFVYVPHDLAAALPTHQVGYDLSKVEAVDLPDMPELDATEPMMEHLALEEVPAHIIKTDTSIIDDITTLLAYVQMHTIYLEQGYVPLDVQREVMSFFVGSSSDARMTFILFLLVEMELLLNNDGRLETNRPKVKQWLDSVRTHQIKVLVEAWHQSTAYNELWNVPTLQAEAAGWQNDPRLLRNTLNDSMQFMVTDDWVLIQGLIQELKDSDPDFQRPSGDYNSWYIRDRHSGNYLQGFESWDQVEGAALHFAIVYPMHWLALVDVGHTEPIQDTYQAAAFKLTAFGRAWINRIAWPEVRDPEGDFTIHPDAKIEVSRAISRFDRFQIARFTTWENAGDVFAYRLTAASVQKAAEQGIEVQHIRSFLQRLNNGQAVPQTIEESLARWQGNSNLPAVRIEQLMVLYLDSPETLQQLWDTPELRQYLGRRLGPQAVVVRDDQVEGLKNALKVQGIPID